MSTSSTESIFMGYERMMIITTLVCAFSLGAMLLIARGNVTGNSTTFWSGVVMLVGGVGSVLAFAFWKFLFEFQAGFILLNIIYSDSNKPYQEALYFEEITEITSPAEKEDLRKYIKPNEEYLLSNLMSSPQFYYTKISHRGDRPNNSGYATTHYITLVPFSNAISFFGFNGSFICENYPRYNPSLAVVSGELRGWAEEIVTLELSSLQKFLQKLGKQYDTRAVARSPIYLITGCTAVSQYSTLLTKIQHLDNKWIKEQAEIVIASNDKDLKTENDMLYSVLEQDRLLLSKKLRPAFYQSPVIEKSGLGGRIENLSSRQKLVLSVLGMGVVVLSVLLYTGRI